MFGCTAGKDRTGIVAALALSVAGVRRDVIIEDYALTAIHVAALLRSCLICWPISMRAMVTLSGFCMQSVCAKHNKRVCAQIF